MPRLRRSRANPQFDAREAGTPIPDKLYFRIGEASELTRTKAYVLRFWETEFPALKPLKSRSGHRLYRREDIQTIVEIKRLLYEEGFTIEGARKQLANHSEQSAHERSLSPAASRGIGMIKRELEGILTILSRR